MEIQNSNININYGDNLHTQYNWNSDTFNELLSKLYFQLVRQPKDEFNLLLLDKYEFTMQE